LLKSNLKILLLRTTDGKIIFRPFGYHKFLLAGFGLLLDGVRGLVIGFLIGCFFDTTFVKKFSPPQQLDMRLNFLMLAAFIIQITGLNAQIPLETLKTRLKTQFGYEYLEKRITFFVELLRQRIQVEAICDQIKDKATLNDKVSLIKFLYEISSHPSLNFEKLNQTIFYLASRIELDSSVVKQLSAHYKPKSIYEPNYFKVFNLSENFSYAELRKSYYHLAKKYHPDSQPNISTQQQKIMQDKFRQLRDTYEKVKILKGWK
jgi:DnaJ-domain-containing protein 1